jgi:hypothetical protein
MINVRHLLPGQTMTIHDQQAHHGGSVGVVDAGRDGFWPLRSKGNTHILYLAINNDHALFCSQRISKNHIVNSKATTTSHSHCHVQQALAADAVQCLRDTHHAMTSFLAPARLDPRTTNELVIELRPVSRRLRP